MKFLIDAQLPRRLAASFRQAGFEAIHTLDLPDGNRTTDFVESFLMRREPGKLLLISTGNIRNDELEKLLLSGIQKLIEGFDGFDFIELSRTSMIFHL